VGLVIRGIIGGRTVGWDRGLGNWNLGQGIGDGGEGEGVRGGGNRG
jgi:hypothetical protein